MAKITKWKIVAECDDGSIKEITEMPSNLYELVIAFLSSDNDFAILDENGNEDIEDEFY